MRSLRAGVRVLWVLNPENRSVRVFRESADRCVQFGSRDELTAPEVLPGFSCRIGDLFGEAAESRSRES